MPRKLKSFLVVAVQLVSLAFILLSGPLFAHHKNLLIAELLGIFLGLWAIFEFRKTTFRVTPEVNEGAMLIVSGPYRFFRHPMYTSLLMIAFALIADNYTIERLIAGIILLADLFLKSRLEEKYLERHFRNYKQYKKYTYRIIPFIY